MLNRFQGNIHHVALSRVSPMAVPVMLEIGKEPVNSNALDDFIDEEAEDLLAEAIADLPEDMLA